MNRIDGTPGSYPLHKSKTPTTGSLRFPREWRKTATVVAEPLAADAEIETPEGLMRARAGDYLAQHEDGHAWPIKREVFEATYEEAE